MFKHFILCASLILSVQFCSYNEDKGVFVEETVDYKTTGLPILEVTTPSPIVSKDVWVTGCKVKLDGKLIGSTSMKGRGNSTWLQEKKPYTFKFDEKVSIWDLPKNKRWVLLANAYDRTMMRYDIAFYISRQTEIAWTPKGDYVELVMNGKHYGTYYLCEQVRAGKNRVNTDYLMELDQYYDEVNKFRSIRANLPYMFKDPDDVTSDVVLSMNTKINAIEDMLWDKSRVLSQEYLGHLNINSFIDYWFVQELTMNLECNHPRSTYCYFDESGKLTMGPVWDFDYMTLANTWFDTHFYGEDRNKHRADQFTIRYALYYGKLFEDPYFRKLVQERWEMFREKFKIVPSYIQDLTHKLAKSDLINYPMWPHEMNSGDGNLSFYDSTERLERIYIRKFKFLDERIKKGDFSQP